MSNILLINAIQEQLWDKDRHELNLEKAFDFNTEIKIQGTYIGLFLINRKDPKMIELAKKLTHNKIKITEDLMSAQYYNKDINGLAVLCFFDLDEENDDVLDTSYVKYQFSLNVLKFIEDQNFNDVIYTKDGDVDALFNIEILKFMVPIAYFNNFVANNSDNVSEIALFFDLSEEQVEILLAF